MFRTKSAENIKARLRSILQTDEQREGFLVGSMSDFCDQDGEYDLPTILKSLAESEQAVKNRCDRLVNRKDGADIYNKIVRKVAHTMSEIDQIFAQYCEGHDMETHSEKFTRQLQEWETRWSEFQKMFLQVKPGQDLTRDYLDMKRQIVDAESKQLTHKSKIYDIDMQKPRAFTEITNDQFSFENNTASVNVKGAIYSFKWSKQDKKLTVSRYVNVSYQEAMAVNELTPCP